jgi:hypothetical protein
MTVEIEVTRDDIKNGTWRNCAKCPVALAITRLLKPQFMASVTRTQCSFYLVGHSIHDAPPPSVFLPIEATAFINDFDQFPWQAGVLRNPFLDFTFELNIPEKFLPGY